MIEPAIVFSPPHSHYRILTITFSLPQSQPQRVNPFQRPEDCLYWSRYNAHALSSASSRAHRRTLRTAGISGPSTRSSPVIFNVSDLLRIRILRYGLRPLNIIGSRFQTSNSRALIFNRALHRDGWLRLINPRWPHHSLAKHPSSAQSDERHDGKRDKPQSLSRAPAGIQQPGR
jgi:hypothetical protein